VVILGHSIYRYPRDRRRPRGKDVPQYGRPRNVRELCLLRHLHGILSEDDRPCGKQKKRSPLTGGVANGPHGHYIIVSPVPTLTVPFRDERRLVRHH
jgi:hypothetical protein